MIKVKSEKNYREFQKLASIAFKKLGLAGRAIVEVVFEGEEGIRALNSTFRKVDKATDVLSFPMLNEIKPFKKKNYPFEYAFGGVMLGSIVICESIASSNAENYGHSTKREINYLFLHGLLHLLGYDHEKEEDKKVMRQAEEMILSLAKITRE
jgi:probable rRNA maturation factor